MRQETAELSLTVNRCTQQSVDAAKEKGLVVNLQNAEVYAIGVDSAGSGKADWGCLHDFWHKYITLAGGTLRDYTVLRFFEIR
jgi:hypothetical protein